MRTKKLHVKNSYPALILYLYCAATNANDIKGSLSATSMFSDNSLKAAEEPIEERQDLYRVGLSADYSNWLVEAEANYNWVSHQFTEQSQPDDRYAEGSSSILFGKQEDPLALELAHSQRILLITPDAVALTQNQQERVMVSALPEIRTRIFAADRLTLGGQFVQVSFPDDELQDSQREGLSLGWLRPLSAASFLQLNAQQQTISFDFFPAADYTYSGAMMVYGVKLRKLKYDIEVGYNQSEPKVGEEQGAPSYKVSVIYLSGFNEFDISASRAITDTSFGDGNLDSNIGLPGSDGSSPSVGRIDRSSAELNWQAQIICSRCEFSTGVSAVEDEYLEKDETSLSRYTRARFAYSFSSAATLSFSTVRADVDFNDVQNARDYELSTVSIEYAYNFVNGLGVRLATKNEDRTATNESESGTYDENTYSVGLAYNF
jgi:hypothetical protein